MAYFSRLMVCAQRFSRRRKRSKYLRIRLSRGSALGLESVEGRLLLASIAGISYIDLNGDGVRQNNESPLVGATIYLDTNHNQRFDADEPPTSTDANGSYA